LFILVLPIKPVLALDEIYSPNVEYRELSLEYNGSRTVDSHAAKNDIEGHQLTLEAGLTPRWEVETSASFANDTPAGSLKTQDLEIENRVQFFESGENWLDSGVLVAYDFATQGETADFLEIKLLLQKDVGKITTTANVGFTQDIGRYAAAGGPDYVALSNTRYRYSEYFQPGIELQADLGQANQLGHYGRQGDYLGPAIYGRLIGHLKYQVGLFAGISDAAAQTAGRALLEYEFHF
jgi:hypothetical protein